MVFDEIELLEAVPGETFAMAALGGTLVVDHRSTMSNEVGHKSQQRRLKFGTLDLMARLGQPERRKPGLRIGDSVPPIAANVWIADGAEVAAPDFQDRVQLILMCDPKSTGFEYDTVDLRRVIDRLAGNDRVDIIAMLRNGTTKEEAIDFQAKSGLKCYVACDAAPDSTKRSARGKTQTAFEVTSMPVCIVVNELGNLSYYGYHVGQVNGAAIHIEKMRKR